MEPIIAAICLLYATSGSNSAETSVELESSQWRVVLDGVMGGLSNGKLTETPHLDSVSRAISPSK